MNEPFSDFPETWNNLITDSAEVIADYHKRVIEEVASSVSTYFIRYEDLRNDPKNTLNKIFCFILNEPVLTGTNCERRIHQVVNLGHEASVVYK